MTNQNSQQFPKNDIIITYIKSENVFWEIKLPGILMWKIIVINGWMKFIALNLMFNNKMICFADTCIENLYYKASFVLLTVNTLWEVLTAEYLILDLHMRGTHTHTHN